MVTAIITTFGPKVVEFLCLFLFYYVLYPFFQVIPLHLPPGDTSTERTLQIDGTSDQIESAKQLVDHVISEVFAHGSLNLVWP